MLEIYRVAPILTDLPLGIECIHGYGDYLLVGTKQGNLLLYKLIPKQTKELKFDVHLLRSNKAFSKKPIVQVAGVPEFQLIISLSDNVVSVHGLNKVVSPLITVIQRTKGATLFVVDVQKCQTLTGDIQHTLRMCVVVKRKLMLFYWKNDKFLELAPDLTVPDTPKAVAWCSESLCLGFRNEYSLIQISGKTTELFPLGKHPEPIVTSLDGNRFAVGIDEKTFFLDQDSKPLLRYPITWSDCPSAVCDDSPYLVALLPNSVIEIRTAEPRLLIQKIEDLTSSGKMKHLIRCHDQKGILYVCSNKDIYCIMGRPIEEQTPQLIASKEFELAKQMVNMSFYNTDDSEDREQCEKAISQIENLQAYDYFCKKEFEKAMQLFFKLETHPSLVIGYFPGLLPEYFRSELEYPQEPPAFKGADREAALFALADYLLEVRKKLQKLSESDGNAGNDVNSPRNADKMHYQVDPSVPKSPTFYQYFKTRDKLLEIIDTTLLKCYLLTNPTLVPSLVRLPDNRCHLQETELCLKKDQKYSELIIFYQTRGLHRKALDLLFTQAKKPNSSLPGHEMTIQYLQKLGESNLSLIFEYAKWVLEEYPEDGLRIFTEDIAETESLPRDLVLEYLQKNSSNLIIPYLEHIITVWGDKTPLFHNILANKYREKVRALREEYLNSLPEGQCPASAGQEPGELGILREKLINFLETSDHYSTETLSIFFSNDELWEERAIVAGKTGCHRDALMIYIHYIKDLKKAEEYCIKTYNKNSPGNRDVFLTLLKLYVSNSRSSSVDSSTTSTSLLEFKGSSSSEENLQEALKLLENHPTKMDPISVLVILPSNIPMSALSTYLQTVIRHLLKERHEGSLLKNRLMSQYLSLQKQRIKLYQKHRVLVDESDVCTECLKKLGTSAFLRCPNGDLIHYSCKDRR